MKSGVVDNAKIIGIANRLRVAPDSMRHAILVELVAAIDEKETGEALPAKREACADPGAAESAIRGLRNSLTWPEVKTNPLAVARICRTLRTLREKR